jgi:3-dehydroquinate dehydratase I
MDLKGNEIFTLRSRREGGVGQFSEESRIELIRRMIAECKPPYVDLEISALESHPEMAVEAKSAGCSLIASSHNFESNESSQVLRKLVLNTHKLCEPYAIKIVRGAKHFADNQLLLSLYSLVDRLAPTKLIAFCTGPLGVLSRLSCIQSGSPFTYASFPGKKTAPGQLEVETMQRLFKNW